MVIKIIQLVVTVCLLVFLGMIQTGIGLLHERLDEIESKLKSCEESWETVRASLITMAEATDKQTGAVESCVKQLEDLSYEIEELSGSPSMEDLVTQGMTNLMNYDGLKRGD